MRGVATVRKRDREVLAQHFAAVAELRPNGDHWLEVTGAVGVAHFTRDQVGPLKDAIAEFEREIAFEDRRPTDRLHAARVPLAGARR